MGKKHFLSYSMVALSLLGQRSWAQKHIILIMTDQQRYDAMGCMGNTCVHTPNLDGLAQEGTMFMNAYTASPSSTPARAGLLTGLSPWHHGMLGYGALAEKYKYESPQMLRDKGYYTYGIGKMHWAPQRVLHGFHGTLLDESGREEAPYFKSDYRQWLALQAPGVNPDITGIGWNEHRSGTYQLPKEWHPTAWTGKMACQLIRNYSLDQPLYLKVSFARPHSPYDAPEDCYKQYKGKKVPKPFIGKWAKKLEVLKDPNKHKEAAFGNFGQEHALEARRYYYGNVTFIDEQIGRIIEELKAKGMYDEALIIFTSDHGDMLGDHYHWRKTYPYEGSAHIPMIVKWPKSVDFEVKHQMYGPVELRDVLPTYLECIGEKVPEDMDGKPLQALMRGETWRDYIDIEHATCYSPDNYWCALTDGRIKYIWNFYSGREELFDLTNDPHELVNVSDLQDYQSILLQMRARMIKHLSERGEGFVKDGKLVKRKETMLYGPLFPRKN
jgi:arylsulfatase A-like enzyme